MNGVFMSSPWSLPLRTAGFIGWFIWQFIITSLQVVTLILIPGRKPTPGIVSLKLDALSDSELTILIALITITPDTLVIAVDREKGEMFVHGMFVEGDPEGFRASLRSTHDRMISGLRANPEKARGKGVKA